MKQKKDWKIEFVESDKVIDFSYELVRSVFGFESVFLSNESTLYDFDDSDSTKEQLLARVGEEYKIPLKDYPHKVPYVWEVAEYILRKIEEKFWESQAS